LKKALLLLTILSVNFLISQDNDFIEININATVLDYDSQNEIPFSEVKFLNKNIGTIS